MDNGGDDDDYEDKIDAGENEDGENDNNNKGDQDDGDKVLPYQGNYCNCNNNNNKQLVIGHMEVEEVSVMGSHSKLKDKKLFYL